MWKQIPGWEGKYEVSDEGQVRSVDRLLENRVFAGGRIGTQLWKGRMLVSQATKNGYPLVTFSNRGEGTKSFYVHHLVLLAFVGPCPPGMEACHNNGIRADCRLGNLRYGTRSENARDRHKHGTMNQKRGEAHFCAKLDKKKVIWILMNRGKKSTYQMGRELGVHSTTVWNVLIHRSWKEVSRCLWL